MKNNAKGKMNTYIKYGLIMLVCITVGGVVGAFTSFFDMAPVADVVKGGIQVVQTYILPVMAVLLVLSVLFGEILLNRLSVLFNKAKDVSDEDGDKIEYQMEKMGAIGTTGNVFFDVLAIVMLMNGFSVRYIESLAGEDGALFSLLAAMVIFIIIFFYSGLWSVRYVKKIQRICPEKKADPTSLKFQKQWLESCDEAEREIIYQSSYKTYLFLSQFLPVLLCVTMIGHLLWNTGAMAVFIVGIVWLVMTWSYCRSCVKLQKSKINM